MKADRAAQRDRVLVRLGTAAFEVERVIRLADVRDRKACRYRLTDRNVDRGARLDDRHRGEFEAVVPAGLEIGLSLEFLTRLLGDEMHAAARRVAPEQGALRPVQNLDALDVDELADGKSTRLNSSP